MLASDGYPRMVVNQFFDLLTTRFTAKKNGLQVGILGPPHITMVSFSLDGDRGRTLTVLKNFEILSQLKISTGLF
ncbi:MAG: hypothetical protein ACQZ2J_05230 [Pseudomonas piscis]|uniref:hypothetical protein n=1 Tax=Pseudomonas piscis TaxID=2614538 RepID=UPI003D2BBFE8